MSRLHTRGVTDAVQEWMVNNVGVRVKLNYPDPPCVNLNTLSKGKCFILNRAFRTEYANVYMVVGNEYSFNVSCLCLQTGELNSFGHNTKVIEMVVELNARPVTTKDKEELPF